MDTQAWGEGFRAGQRLREHRSPYDIGTLEAWSWHRGYIEGAAWRMGRRYDDMPPAMVEWPPLPRQQPASRRSRMPMTTAFAPSRNAHGRDHHGR
ncbi:hypothetical protein [Azohydromonas aeria]|uniref:hypothetical protein n=1 Tax=Azohydromonas aeria TaxID=2590212 RepID=UPI0012F8CBED|nr:hypothetical protein [Azohydromonas aeria]